MCLVASSKIRVEKRLYFPTYCKRWVLFCLFFTWLLQIFGAAPKLPSKRICNLLGATLQTMLIEWIVSKGTLCNCICIMMYLYTPEKNKIYYAPCKWEWVYYFYSTVPSALFKENGVIYAQDRRGYIFKVLKRIFSVFNRDLNIRFCLINTIISSLYLEIQEKGNHCRRGS